MDKVSSNPLQPRHRSSPENFQINEAIFFRITLLVYLLPFVLSFFFISAQIVSRQKFFLVVRRRRTSIVVRIHRTINVRDRERGVGLALSPLTFDVNVFVGGLRPGSKQPIHPLNPIPRARSDAEMQFTHSSPSLALPRRCFATRATWVKRERIRVTPVRGCPYTPVT